MSRITEELIRRKAEHHDGILADLEEVSLHQLELEGGLEVLNALCRKLRILYLQNNVLPRISNLHHLKDLRYLNLALNNIRRIEGLSSCEFIHKLDLTVNFIDVDQLEASAEHLSGLLHMRELFLMGNPCMEWPGARPFLVAAVPQLAQIDGKEITRAERIAAAQAYKALRGELRGLAEAKAREKGHTLGGGSAGAAGAGAASSDEEDEDEESAGAWTPEARVKLARELAASKASKESRERELAPKKRDLASEHAAAVAKAREKEAEAGEGRIRQCNEGRWNFSITDDDGVNWVLRMELSRFLDTSLVDVDVHPTYVSVVIKNKAFRLTLMDEVQPAGVKCARSTTTGELVVTMPKLYARPSAQVAAPSLGAGAAGGDAPLVGSKPAASRKGVSAGKAAPAGDRIKLLPPESKPLKLADELIAVATTRKSDVAPASAAGEVLSGGSTALLAARKPASRPAPPPVVDDDDVPPLE